MIWQMSATEFAGAPVRWVNIPSERSSDGGRYRERSGLKGIALQQIESAITAARQARQLTATVSLSQSRRCRYTATSGSVRRSNPEPSSAREERQRPGPGVSGARAA